MSGNTVPRGPDTGVDPFSLSPSAVAAPVMLGRFNASAAEYGVQVMGGPVLPEGMRDLHGNTLGAIAQQAQVTVVHSSDPAEHRGVVTPAERTRSFKSYEPTASHIASTLGEIGLTQPGGSSR